MVDGRRVAILDNDWNAWVALRNMIQDARILIVHGSFNEANTRLSKFVDTCSCVLSFDKKWQCKTQLYEHIHQQIIVIVNFFFIKQLRASQRM
jgi:hypothetical protein